MPIQKKRIIDPTTHDKKTDFVGRMQKLSTEPFLLGSSLAQYQHMAQAKYFFRQLKSQQKGINPLASHENSKQFITEFQKALEKAISNQDDNFFRNNKLSIIELYNYIQTQFNPMLITANSRNFDDFRNALEITDVNYTPEVHNQRAKQVRRGNFVKMPDLLADELKRQLLSINSIIQDRLPKEDFTIAALQKKTPSTNKHTTKKR